MTGPEHYREAERLIAYATNGDEEYGDCAADDTRIRGAARDLALIHATLAHTAATAFSDPDGGMPPDDWNAWREVAAVHDDAQGGAE